MDKIIFSKISTAEILLNQKKVASGSIINIKNLKFSFLLINNTFSNGKCCLIVFFKEKSLQ